MKLSSKRKDLPHCNSFIANQKATKTTQIRTIEPITSTKIHNKNVFPPRLLK